jgi:hypothetical protein
VTSNCESECDATQQSKTTAPFNYLECAIVELQKGINNNCVIFLGGAMDLCAYVGSWYGCLCVCSFLVCGRVSRESLHKIQCRGSFGVGTHTHFGQKAATFRHVGDMLPTCRQHSQLSPSPKLV